MRSRGRPIAAVRLALILAAWREFLDIAQSVETVRISPLQVTDERGRPGAVLIGVSFDARSATIYHTRSLTVEDLIHELLHVANPVWTEDQVVRETGRLWRRGAVMPQRTSLPLPRRQAA